MMRKVNRWLSVPVTLLAAVLAHALNTPNPMMILIIPVVYFTYSDGFVGGTLSGIAAIAYALYFFSDPGALLSFDAINMQKVLTIVVAVGTIVLLVGRMKRRDDLHVNDTIAQTENFLKILSGMDVQLLVTDMDTDTILFANEKMNQAYHVTGDPVGQPCWKVYHQLEQRCEGCRKGDLSLQNDVPIEWENYNKHTERWYHNRESTIHWTDGRVVHLQQATDITRDKLLRQQLILARDEAQASSRSKGEFLSRMSHEIRTPMNAIIGMTEIAAKADSLDRVRECLDRVQDASGHLLAVINDILDMSKIDAGKFELSPSDFTLEHMLQRISNVNNYRFEEKEQRFSIVVEPDVPVAIVTDQQRLAQVITNLLSNAAKFTPNGGRVHLHVSSLGDEGARTRLRFVVRDDGIGMTPEQMGRLFESFQQADESITRRFGGTGLGLAISKTIVEMMDGRIWVESEPGAGSTFSFEIVVDRGFATRSSYLSPNIDWGKVRLLAVDDSPDVCRYFDAIMTSLGIACDTAGSSKEALSLLAKNRYDIAFIDWKMPGTNGIELTDIIRRQMGDAMPAMVLISSSDWSQLENEAGAVGIHHFIAKPLLPSPIIDCINTCFGEVAMRADETKHTESNVDLFLGLRILLAEDIQINRDIIKVLLEETGVEIVEAENGAAACALYCHNPGGYDLIFMDIHMPQMDGYTATEYIRALDAPEAKAVPIIAMTANVFREDIEKCLAAGMNDHIGKPVSLDDMLIKMKRHIPARR